MKKKDHVPHICLTIFLIEFPQEFPNKISNLQVKTILVFLLGIFFFVLFVFDFYPWMFYIAVGWGLLAYIEKIVVLLWLDDIKIGVKGLYWLMNSEK